MVAGRDCETHDELRAGVGALGHPHGGREIDDLVGRQDMAHGSRRGHGRAHRRRLLPIELRAHGPERGVEVSGVGKQEDADGPGGIDDERGVEEHLRAIREGRLGARRGKPGRSGARPVL